ncbi:MAG TPA: DNA-3-methyladenine glycosylase 2 family protein [Candidatus Melainabacteria bacterium]|nr:DNA-3-methyladenine glycosylase 2 family protein [Candidatus Melainabacteria bacterium]HIN63863.1 DNA-3-methyladenine glycosylase 2 family protein [Candidatus Obscuribacterales bacterium]
MILNRESCYEVLRARDPRFDGVFFVAVKSTKIYCRTVCTAKTPMLKNCTFYSTAAAAENAGYRPCLRCRPELAPGNASVDAVSRLAAIALNRIEDGALCYLGVDELAAEMGISGRHLRRVIESEFGVSPIQLAQTQRLLLAKRLLTDTNLPVTEIAFASGFSSVRRFNSLFQERYSLNPTQLRKRRTSDEPQFLVCEVSYRQPFDFDGLLNFLSYRACPGVELVQGGAYIRTASFGKHSGWLAIRQNAQKNTLSIQLSNSLAPVLLSAVARCKRLMDTQADPSIVAATLGDLSKGREGLRVPGAFYGFELALRAILGQQVSVKAASTLHGRIVRKFGTPIETPFPQLDRLAPAADVLAGLEPEDLSGMGITGARINSIIALSRAVAGGSLSLEPGQDVQQTSEKLKSLPGFGEWTAQYIAMRALAWPDAFLGSDLGIKKALGMTKEKQILEHAERWSPWRSYASMHLWRSLDAQPLERKVLKTQRKRVARVKV